MRTFAKSLIELCNQTRGFIIQEPRLVKLASPTYILGAKFLVGFLCIRMKELMSMRLRDLHLQGDHSGCAKPPLEIKTKVPFLYMDLILKRNICFDVNGRFATT